MRRKRKAALFRPIPHPDAGGGSTTLGPGSPSPLFGSPALAKEGSALAQHPVPELHDQNVITQIDSVSKPTELYAPQPMYELPSQSYSHELVAETLRGFTSFNSNTNSFIRGSRGPNDNTSEGITSCRGVVLERERGVGEVGGRCWELKRIKTYLRI
ncbi:hypothetical protein VTK26DRAFT_8866 [Humicola hyalothermophila]